MKLIWLAFLLVALHETSAGRKVQPPINVVDMCFGGACPDDLVCRVLDRSGKRRITQSKCFKCVPAGIDEVCNNNGYRRAVLAAPLRKPQQVYCRLGNIPDKFLCPQGSVCVALPDTPDFGVCCYGKPPAHIPVGPVSNNDPQCSKCNPPCSRGYACVKDLVCGRIKHVCKPEEKAGSCPVLSMPPGYVCTNPEKRTECEHDQDCSGTKKCCATGCGGTACVAV